MIQSCSKTICIVETVYVNVCGVTVWLWCRRVQHESSKCVPRKSLTLKLLELMFSHQWWMKLLCVMWMEYHSYKPHIWLSADFAVPSALRIISGVIFFTTHNFTVLARCHSFHRPRFQLQWNIAKKTKNSLYAPASHRVSNVLEHLPTSELLFLRSLWREPEHKVNIVFIISRPETGLQTAVTSREIAKTRTERKELLIVSVCSGLSSLLSWVLLFLWVKLSETLTFPDFAVTLKRFSITQ